MHRALRAANFCAILLLVASAAEVRAQERRDSTRRAAATSAASAEEMHRIRRMWLEQRRLGTLDHAPPVFGSAVVGPPRAGRATGVAVGAAVGGGYGAYGARHGFAGGIGCGARGFDPYGGRGWSHRGGAWGCAPFLFPGVPFVQPGAFGFDRHDGLPYPAYPPVGRFYGRFHPDAFRSGSGVWSDPLLFGIQEYELGWWGPWRAYPGTFGWADGGYGWYSSPPWSRSPADCVDVMLELGNGRAHRLQLGLQSLGLADARDFDLAIDARLSEGRAVTLQGLDGRLVRIEPGTPIEDILVRPCGG
jgi:hypothetical protein